jgi:diguanylate cyclase (GGDEF)-like protein/PAS domain S-box-containing protein
MLFVAFRSHSSGSDNHRSFFLEHRVNTQPRVRIYQTMAIAVGGLICYFLLVRLHLSVLDYRFLILAVTPVVLIIYFTYRTYLKRIEASARHAEHAESLATAVKESEERFRVAFDHATGMALATSDGQWLRVNSSLCKMLAYSEAELLGTSLSSITHPDDAGWMNEQIINLHHGSISSIQMEQRCLRSDGQIIWVLLSVTKVAETRSAFANLILQMQDMTDRKQAEEQLVHDAFHDALTGLPNRALFMDHLRKSVARWKRKKQSAFAVLFLDLDEFKKINDTLGHMEGDRLLVEISRRLSSIVRPSDTVARLGGDEFTILLDDLNSPEEAIVAVKRLVRKLAEPISLSGREVVVTASIGVALSAAGYEHPEELLRDADVAMYRAKDSGRARYEVFDGAMNERVESQLQLEADLKRAVERAELALEYQPIVELETGRIAGFEALLRWQHPKRGMISPLDFISVAEETGAIVPIGEWVLEQGCRQIREWQKSCPQDPPLYISINLSVRQFTEHLVEQVAIALDRTGLNPASLRLEITESMLMNGESAIRMLSHLHALGVGISIDDFGTGYSSLSYLHRLPISMLKIDQSFVNSMSQNKESLEIVRTIVTLSQSLNLKIVAEGIETEDQLEKLRELKCDYGQGFFFSKALTVEWAASLLFANSTYESPPPPNSEELINYNGSFVA